MSWPGLRMAWALEGCWDWLYMPSSRAPSDDLHLRHARLCEEVAPFPARTWGHQKLAGTSIPGPLAVKSPQRNTATHQHQGPACLRRTDAPAWRGWADLGRRPLPRVLGVLRPTPRGRRAPGSESAGAGAEEGSGGGGAPAVRKILDGPRGACIEGRAGVGVLRCTLPGSGKVLAAYRIWKAGDESASLAHPLSIRDP